MNSMEKELHTNPTLDPPPYILETVRDINKIHKPYKIKKVFIRSIKREKTHQD